MSCIATTIVEVPFDIKALFGKGRLLVNATFDGIPYSGQVVKMGTPCYIIGVSKQILHSALPEAEERISWSMPTYWKKHNIIHFAASKKHIGLYPGPAAVEQFSKELQGYKTDKGTIRIPYGKVDAALIEKIAKWCLETGNHA